MSKNPAKNLALPAPSRVALVPPASFTLLAAPSRLEFIDFARGIAVLAMIGFHLVFDLDHFSAEGRLGLPSWFWWAVPSCIGGTFLSLLGASATIRWEREGELAVARLRAHALRIGGCALVVNLVTFVATPATPIYFGVLHAAAISLFTLSWVRGRTRLAGILGGAMTLLGAGLATTSFSFPHLLWLGFRPSVNAGWDYYPILPWVGVALLGGWLSLRWQFAAQASNMPIPARAKTPFLWLGRHSLFVYFVHQPILLALLWLFGITGS